MNGSQNITLSFSLLSFSPSSALSFHLSLSSLFHLSVHFLSVCLPVQVCLSVLQTRGKEKCLTQYGCRYEGICHQDTSAADRQKIRQTERRRERQDKGNIKEEGNVSSLHTTAHRPTWVGPTVAESRDTRLNLGKQMWADLFAVF